MALILLTSSISTSYKENKPKSKIEMGIWSMLEDFEKRSCIELQNKSDLINKMWMHFKPAYYRIKYSVYDKGEIERDFRNIFNEEFRELFHIVKKSIYLLEKELSIAIPEKEIMYLTAIIGGKIRRQGDSVNNNIKAIVVCPNGVSISKLMEVSLRSLFPEFIFLDALSIKEFYEYTLNYDIVFSPTYLKTEKLFFQIQIYMTDQEKIHLRGQVMQSIFGISSTINVDEILDIVSEHTKILEEDSLRRRLNSYFKSSFLTNNLNVKSSNHGLTDILTEENITIVDSVSSWRESIELASLPLLKNNSINENYIKRMVELHDVSNPYIIYGSDIAIPHATFNDGVKKLGISMLKVTNGIKVNAYQTIYLIFVLAPIDAESHLEALYEISFIADSKTLIDAIKKKSNSSEVFGILQKIGDEKK